jgi:4-hydroxybenzoate polyprenyltransferase
MMSSQALMDAPARVSMAATVGGYARLLRPANLVTSGADVLAGYAVAGLPDGSLALRLVASVALYGGGVVLNDFFDRELDAVERPERPIPKGLVPPGSAAVLGALLLVGGMAAAFAASASAGVIAVLIAGAVLAYNAAAKHHRWAGPAVMGTCRGLNLLLGLSASSTALTGQWYLALLPLAYIGGITALSAGEVKGGTRNAGALALALFAAVVLALIGVNYTSLTRLAYVAPFLALLVWRVGPPLWRAYRIPESLQIRAAVHAAIVSLVVLDAAIAAGYAGYLYATALLALLLVTAGLGRLFPVT